MKKIEWVVIGYAEGCGRWVESGWFTKEDADIRCEEATRVYGDNGKNIYWVEEA